MAELASKITSATLAENLTGARLLGIVSGDYRAFDAAAFQATLQPLATTAAAGFMSSGDKSKLDGIATGANNYVLPAPTTTVIGGVKRNAGTAGQFVNGIGSDGSLTYGTPGGSASITTPKVLHVTTAGNDTTGDGSLGAPYLTGTKAFEVAFALGGQSICITFGVGTFVVNTTEGWPSRIAVRGMGSPASALTIYCAGPVYLCSDKSITVTVNAVQSTAGEQGPSITLTGVWASVVSSQGAQGAQGAEGAPGTPETGGGDGGTGGDGGSGGNIALIESWANQVESTGGGSGLGGAGGADGGAGGGNAGADGNPGARGGVFILRSHVGELYCGAYEIGGSNLITVHEGTLSSDYSGNSNMPVPNL